MRVKDEIKQEALFEATIKVVNQIGFASSSVSKIAKEAGVSPATIYIYHKNKEDLLISSYVEIKKKLGQALLPLDPLGAQRQGIDTDLIEPTPRRRERRSIALRVLVQESAREGRLGGRHRPTRGPAVSPSAVGCRGCPVSPLDSLRARSSPSAPRQPRSPQRCPPPFLDAPPGQY